MTEWLISTKYNKEGSRTGQVLIFWNDETGKLTEIPHGKSHRPYFYTRLKESQLLNIEKVRECGYVKLNERGEPYWNNKKVIGCEEVDKIHPRTRKKMKVTKVIVTQPRYVTDRDTGTGLSQLLLPTFVYNNHIKYADLFNIEHNITIGMPYNISTISPEIDWYHVKHHPIYNLKQIERYKKELPKKMYDWMMSIFTTPFPQFKEHLVALDIEIDFNFRDALNSFEAVSPISSITLSWYKGDDIHHLSFVISDEVRKIKVKKFNLKHPNHLIRICDNEVELLKKFMIFLFAMKQKFVVGYNLDMFDIPYIVTRMKYLGIYDSRIWGFMRPEDEDRTYKKKDRIVKGLKDKFLIDLYPFFSNPSIKNYAFKNKYKQNSLDDVSKELIGETKYDYEGRVTDLCMQELLYYNAQDTSLCLKLATFDNEVVMKLICMAMRMGHLTVESAVRRQVSAIISNIFYRALHFYNMLAISRIELSAIGKILSASTTGKRYGGAIVIEPEKGVHYDIIVADVASLYPTMIVNHNLCYTTMNCGHEECKDNKIKVSEGAYHQVCTKYIGLFPSVVGFIKDARVYYYKPMKNTNAIAKVIEQWLKVIINASYGVAGFESFPFFCGPVAECVTATGRDTLIGIKETFEAEGLTVFYGDSVTADTPIITNLDGYIEIMPIKELENHEFRENLRVWTEKGWTRILKIHKHKTKKKIYRILTHTGCVDVTEDHSLLKPNNNIVRPSEILIGDKLLHSFPEIKSNMNYISKDEAWIMGLFLADGSCGIYNTKWGTKYSWYIGKNNLPLMKELKKKLLKVYGHFTDFKIIDIRKSTKIYRVIPKGNIKDMVKIYLSLYTEDGYKKIPSIILNSKKEIKKAFFEGYYRGDGDKKSGSLRCDIKGKIGAQGLYFLAKSIGYKVSINTRRDKLDIFRLNISNNNQRYSSTKIKKIELLREEEENVYDLTTYNHHFHAGVGELIVHNTDSVFIKGLDVNHFKETMQPKISEKYDVDIDIEETGLILVLHKKKNYVVIEQKDGKLHKTIKGLVGKKRDTPLIIQQAFNEWIAAIEKFNRPEQIKELYFNLIAIRDKFVRGIRLKHGSIEDYKITKQLSRPLSKYTQQRAPHVRAAKKLVEAIQSSSKHPIDENIIMRKGSFIDFVYVIDKPSMDNKILGVEPIEIAKKRDLDYQEYIKRLNNVFKQLIQPVKDTMPKKKIINTQVDDFFAIQK